MFKWYKVGVAVLLVVALLVTFGCAPPPVEEEEEAVVEEVVVEEKFITVGMLGSLTGPLRSVAGSHYGIEDYMTYANEKGGIEYVDPKTGKTEHLKFKWLVGDMAWDSAKSISLYERFKAAGAKWIFSNGSVPSVSIYALMARDHIPGMPCACTGELCFYELDEPYLLANWGFMPGGAASYLGYFIKELWDKPGTPKVAIVAADVGSRRVYDLPEASTYEAIEQIGGELLPIEYIPIAPVDIKIQLGRLADQGVNFIWQDHWGDAALRVFIHNAIDLKLWEKDITLAAAWMDPKVSLAEPDVWNTYNEMGGRLYCYEVGISGCPADYDNYADELPGLKSSFDLCKKYRDKLPEEMGGGFYTAGYMNGIVLELVLKNTLEKYGYEGLTGENIREQLFSVEEVIDTGGLYPPYLIDYGSGVPLGGGPCLPALAIKDGHHVFNPDKYKYPACAPIWGMTRFNILHSDPDWQAEWGDKVFTNFMEPIL